MENYRVKTYVHSSCNILAVTRFSTGLWWAWLGSALPVESDRIQFIDDKNRNYR